MIWDDLKHEILGTQKSCGRTGELIQVLPVSKGQAVENIDFFYRKHTDFPRCLGESYLQELEMKSSKLSHLNLKWHYLGPLQSRKIEAICKAASVLHGVHRSKEINALAKISNCPEFYIQLNISDELSKSGCEINELDSLISLIKGTALQSKFVGLMGMAAPIDQVGENQVRSQFQKLRLARDQIQPGFVQKLGLSMGMSEDYIIAIQEGATLLRLGSVIFGDRPVDKDI